MKASVNLSNVNLRFKFYDDKGATLKETFINKILGRKNNEKTEFWALNNINLQMSAGDRIGIIGNNGAGKSTLLKLITKIYEPTSGKVEVSGKVAPLIELGAGFNPELSGLENIYLNGAVMGFPKKEMAKQVEEIVKFAELEEFVHMPVKYYSTGMYMRLAFTIATQISPEVLIIDEVFAGGDINFVKKAEERMNKLIKNSQIVLMVSHSMGLVENNCNRVILLEKGQIVADGKPNEIIPLYESR